MDEEKKDEPQNTPMTIGEDWYCYSVDFDHDKPYVIVCSNDNSEEEKIPIPKQLAHYLKTHWCGSQIIHDKIADKARARLQQELRDLLGIEPE